MTGLSFARVCAPEWQRRLHIVRHHFQHRVVIPFDVHFLELLRDLDSLRAGRFASLLFDLVAHPSFSICVFEVARVASGTSRSPAVSECMRPQYATSECSSHTLPLCLGPRQQRLLQRLLAEACVRRRQARTEKGRLRCAMRYVCSVLSLSLSLSLSVSALSVRLCMYSPSMSL